MNEFDFIERLREQAGARKHSSRVITGIGDDACVLSQSANRDLVVTTDLLIEGIDFYTDSAPAQMLGHKALAVSLSDIAAMGARPFWSLLSIGMPTEIWQDHFKEEFMAGYFKLADQFGVTLTGGDLSEARSGIVIDSIVLGETAAGATITRSRAQPGDQIYVTGTLGGAAAGLKLIEMGARVDEAGLASLPRPGQRPASPTVSERPVPRLVGFATGSVQGSNPTVREGGGLENAELKAIESLLLRQLRPQPRVGWGIVLGEERLAAAMIDISDGLSSDVAHLCAESKVGVLIDASSLPIDPDVSILCGRRALDPLMLALHGGEDFELLFVVRPDDVARLPRKVDGVPVSRIGQITEVAGQIRITEKNRVWDLKPEGFDHFRKGA
jgi:thiamine-monophosphate kinase